MGFLHPASLYHRCDLNRVSWWFLFPIELLLGEVGHFDNELSAYLWFDYLRGRPGVDPSQVLLMVTEEEDEAPLHRIQMMMPNDAVTAIPFLAELEAKGFIHKFDLAFSGSAAVESRGCSSAGNVSFQNGIVSMPL